MNRAVRNLGLGLLLLTLPGCVTFTWQREHRFVRPPGGSLQQLEPGTTDLTGSLSLLGAPLFVWETPNGFAMAYGWYFQQDLGGSVSVPVSEAFNASLNLRDLDSRMRGVVLFFGPDGRLELVQRGLLVDLTASARRTRPAFDEDMDPERP